MSSIIRFYVEQRVLLTEDPKDEGWLHVPAPSWEELYVGEERGGERFYSWYNEQNYWVFGLLSSFRAKSAVRMLPEEARTPISTGTVYKHCRGIPCNASLTFASRCLQIGGFGHHHTWFTLRELVSFFEMSSLFGLEKERSQFFRENCLRLMLRYAQNVGAAHDEIRAVMFFED